MGLDTVELVMEIEEEFTLEIPNAVAPALNTVGDIHSFVLDTLRGRGELSEPEQVWLRLKRILVEMHGIPPELVIPSASITYDLGLD